MLVGGRLTTGFVELVSGRGFGGVLDGASVTRSMIVVLVTEGIGTGFVEFVLGRELGGALEGVSASWAIGAFVREGLGTELEEFRPRDGVSLLFNRLDVNLPVVLASVVVELEEFRSRDRVPLLLNLSVVLASVDILRVVVVEEVTLFEFLDTDSFLLRNVTDKAFNLSGMFAFVELVAFEDKCDIDGINVELEATDSFR